MIITSMKTESHNIPTPYESPDFQVVPQELAFLICISDGENEDTGEENW